MKPTYILLYTLLAATIVFSGCKKNISDPEFGAGDMPRIFQMGDNFRTSFILEQGDTAKFNHLLFSPAGKVNISWKVNDVIESKDTVFNFVPTTGGEFKIILEAEYNGLKTIRSSTVLVKPSTYTPRAYTKIALGYLSDNGVPADVNWSFVTHVAYQSGKVHSDGTLDITLGEVNQKMDELVARGHINGRAVLLSLAGRLSGIDGWALYGSTDFGDAIRDAAKRSQLVLQVKDYVKAKRLDGVDVMMTDINGDPNYSANLSALGAFVSDLRSALAAGAIITCTVTPAWQHWEYPDLSAADWVNVRAFEDGEHVGPGASRGQPSSYDFMLSAANIWKNFHVSADKAVIGMPAFGLRYNAVDAGGNNLDWGSFDYLMYKSILSIDPSADSKEQISSAQGIYYNGIPLIKQKAAFIKTSGFKGAYMWTIDYDAPDTTKSLMRTMYNELK